MVSKQFVVTTLLSATMVFSHANADKACSESLVEVNGVVFEKFTYQDFLNDLILIATFGDKAVIESCGQLIQINKGQSIDYGTIVNVGLGYIELEYNNESTKINIRW